MTSVPATDRLLLVTHKDCMLHDSGPNHVESPERLKAVLEALDGDGELGAVMKKATSREACASTSTRSSGRMGSASLRVRT